MKILILSTLILTGCCTPEIRYVDRIVKVPEIIEMPAPDLPHVEPLGVLPVDLITLDSTYEETAKAYVKTVEILENKAKQYKEALEVPNEE